MKAKTAIILLHEIYGINPFITQTHCFLEHLGYHVVVPNFLNRECFSYEDADLAYTYFMQHVGFERYKEILQMIHELKRDYNKVYLLGFSVGATLAWKCCEYSACDGIICCYGSRIRDYSNLNSKVPVLLLFANQDSFNVDVLVQEMQDKRELIIKRYESSHGFMDSYSTHFDKNSQLLAWKEIQKFLTSTTPNFANHSL